MGELELDFIKKALYGQCIDTAVQSQWGPFGTGILRFSPEAVARIGSVFGWIMGIAQYGETDAARRLARDFFRGLDRLNSWGSDENRFTPRDSLRNYTLNGYRFITKIPTYLVDIGDDGGFNDLWFAIWRLIPDAAETDTPGKLTTIRGEVIPGADIRYTRDMNGALIYHGPKAGEKFSVTQNDCLWSIHT